LVRVQLALRHPRVVILESSSSFQPLARSRDGHLAFIIISHGLSYES
jgi:hypothetical protein